MDVVERADVISKDFARKFKEKIEGKRKSGVSGRLPLVAQTDFAYLCGLAFGKKQLPEDGLRKKEVLRIIKGAVRNCLAQNMA